MMIPQIAAIRHYMNRSWQECLNALNDAVQYELKPNNDARLKANGDPRPLILCIWTMKEYTRIDIRHQVSLGSQPQ